MFWPAGGVTRGPDRRPARPAPRQQVQPGDVGPDDFDVFGHGHDVGRIFKYVRVRTCGCDLDRMLVEANDPVPIRVNGALDSSPIVLAMLQDRPRAPSHSIEFPGGIGRLKLEEARPRCRSLAGSWLRYQYKPAASTTRRWGPEEIAKRQVHAARAATGPLPPTLAAHQ